MNSTDYLMNVPQENYFKLADGKIIRNLEELYAIIRDSGDTVFFDHVTPDRNDFASWIKECVKHQDLHNRLMRIKDRESFLNVLNQEITTLKNPKVSETMKFFSEDYDPKADVKKNETQVNQNSVHDTVQYAPISSNAPSNASAQSSASSPQPSPDGSSSTASSTGSSSNSATSELVSGLSVELDFEQVLGPIIQEIQEEIFFWQ